MRCPFTRLAVALVTFLVGVGLTLLWPTNGAAPRVEQYVTLEWSVDVYEDKATPARPQVNRVESPEETAARLAEEFVARNGYTDLPAERDKLSYESLEGAGDDDSLLEMRRDTLERKAYAVFPGARRDADGWTVVFRYAPPYVRYDDGSDEGFPTEQRGRGVTMDKNFRSLRVEHVDINLAKVKKKL